MSEKPYMKRLSREYRAICKEPVPSVVAHPLSSNILDWHYVFEGSEGTPFAGGYYYGRIKFPTEYPFKPPSISMTTPNGRFKTQTKLCLSMSDFHPESWNPMWSVSSILTGLLSFMNDDSPTTGSLSSTDEDKRKLAKASLAFNCKNKTFRELFPEYVEKYEQQVLAERTAAEVTSAQDSSSVTEPSGPNKLKNRVAKEEDVKKVEAPREVINNGQRRRQSFPKWVLILLFLIFALVMALPLFYL